MHPAKIHASPPNMPPNINHRIFPKVLISASPLTPFQTLPAIHYFVKNEFISLGHRLHVYDAAHNEIGFIKQKLFCFLPTFEIEWNGQLMGHIEKRFALFRPQYDVDFMGWRAEGDFMGWDYDVYEACSAVVHVHKKLLSWGDTYVIEYDNPSNEIPALLLVLAIDAANCSQNNG